jgi:hypothetical protein
MQFMHGRLGYSTWERQVALRIPLPSVNASIAMPPSMTGM